eukprot:13024-Heterococcus_DN1.PRE.1
MLAIQAALWSNDCLNFDQAQQLDEDCECLQCIPRELRTHFKVVINTAQPNGDMSSTKVFEPIPPKEESWLASIATQLFQIGSKVVPGSWRTASTNSDHDEPDSPKLISKTL